MAIESIISLRGFAKIALALLLFSVLLCEGAAGLGAPPLVTSSVSTGFTHPAKPAWGTIYSTAITPDGDWLVLDGSKGALYEFPANGGAMVTLLGAGVIGGGYPVNPSVALDPYNAMYLEGDWSNCIIRLPYDATNKTWVGLSTVASSGTSSNCSTAGLSFIQYNLSWPDGAWGIQPMGLSTTALDSNGNFSLIISSRVNSALYKVPVTMSNGVATPGKPVTLLYNATQTAATVAVDPWGNVFFVEVQDPYEGPSTFPQGVFEIPAGTTDLNGDTGLTRVDPAVLPDVTAVATDAAGNLYVSDGEVGVVFIPAAGSAGGTPKTADAVLLTPDAATGSVSIDWKRQILYVPTTTVQSNGQANVAEVSLGAAELGSSAVGTATAATTVFYAFSGSVTPASFVIEESGTATPDFAIASGGTCVTGTAQTIGGNCKINVTETPLSAGGVSAKLLLLDSSKNILASTSLHGTGTGPAIAVTPALESAIGAGLITPSQVATDAVGNSYVVDAGLNEVLQYAAGSSASSAGVSVGKGLTAPTGVAVDGAGDVLIADSGKIIEVPNTPSGLNAAGQVTLKTGLGAKLNLAVDGLGNLYVADPDNARVVQLGLVGGTTGGMLSPEIDLTGFTAPSVVTVDGSNNLYVLDGGKLIEVQQPVGTQTTLLTTLSGATGLAFDASGALYASLPSGTVRIPSVSGVLTESAETPIAASVTNPAGLALDKSGNLYIADGTAKDLELVSHNGLLNFGSPSATTSLNADVLNIGNSALTVTALNSSNVAAFTTAGCDSAVSSGDSCTADITMLLGPGIQGALSSVITIASDAANSPVVIDASGIGAALADSTAAISVSKTATVLSVPITVTVTSASGSGTAPTGNVVISVDGVAQPVATLTTSGSSGTVTVTLTTGFTAGSHTFSVVYIGDRVYGTSNASVTATVAKAPGVMVLPTPPAYTLSTSDGEETYGNVQLSYETNYMVKVIGASGVIPTGTITFYEGSTISTPCIVTSGDIGAIETVGGTKSVPTPGEADFPAGCLSISTNTNSPNELTTHTLTSVVYSGDANYAGSTATTTSAGGPIVFEELRQSSVQLTATPATVAISSGKGSATLSISSILGYGVSTDENKYPDAFKGGVLRNLNNYMLPLGFTCQGLPARSSCTFTGGNYTDLSGVLHTDEVSVDTDPAKTESITVTINTDVSSGTTTTASKSSHAAPFEFAAMFGLGLAGLAFGRKSGRKGRVLMLICLLVFTGAMASMTACSTKVLGPTEIPTTPAGTYPVLITAQQVGEVTVLGNLGTDVILYGSTLDMSIPLCGTKLCASGASPYTLSVTVQ